MSAVLLRCLIRLFDLGSKAGNSWGLRDATTHVSRGKQWSHQAHSYAHIWLAVLGKGLCVSAGDDDDEDSAAAAGSPPRVEGLRSGAMQEAGRNAAVTPPAHPSWAGSGRALPAGLPAALSLDPGRLATMRDSFQDDGSAQVWSLSPALILSQDQTLIKLFRVAND